MDFTNEARDKNFDTLMEKDAIRTANIFPELAWNNVLGKLVNRVDIENCSNASPFFGDLLREKREKEVVLPVVFRILAQRYSDWDNNDESYKETNFESISWQRPDWPHRMTGIWKCRLVCNKWNEAIEELYRNEDAGHYKIYEDFRNDVNKQVVSKWATDNFYKESHVVKFLDHFQATHYSASVGQSQVSKKCPFLGRAVQVEYIREFLRDSPNYISRVMEMFGKFGDQVHYFKLAWQFRDTFHDYALKYLKMRQMVELMPNLKVLRIYDSGTIRSKELVHFLNREIIRNPFPIIKNLMISLCGTPCILTNHLVHRNRLNISRLEARDIHFIGNCAIFAEELPNLIQLSLMQVQSIEILKSFESYPATLNLEKFSFRCAQNFAFVPWARFFSAIQSKISSDSCTDLALNLPHFTSKKNTFAEEMSILEESLACRLGLANIQRCEISSLGRFSLDFFASI